MSLENALMPQQPAQAPQGAPAPQPSAAQPTMDLPAKLAALMSDPVTLQTMIKQLATTGPAPTGDTPQAQTPQMPAQAPVDPLAMALAGGAQ